KAAATAAYWHSGQPADLVLFAWPDSSASINRHAWRWSGMGDIWLGRDQAGTLQGLDQFSGMSPPVRATFWSFRLAMMIGLLMMAAVWLTMLPDRRVHCDAGALSRWGRPLLKGMTSSGWLLLLGGVAHILLGGLPYAVSGTVSMTEVLGSASIQ